MNKSNVIFNQHCFECQRQTFYRMEPRAAFSKAHFGFCMVCNDSSQYTSTLHTNLLLCFVGPVMIDDFLTIIIIIKAERRKGIKIFHYYCFSDGCFLSLAIACLLSCHFVHIERPMSEFHLPHVCL